MYQHWRWGLGQCPQKYTSEGGAVGGARPILTLLYPYTLIVVGGPKAEGQEAAEACHPQHTGSSFPGQGLGVLLPRGTQDPTAIPCLPSG